MNGITSIFFSKILKITELIPSDEISLKSVTKTFVNTIKVT